MNEKRSVYTAPLSKVESFDNNWDKEPWESVGYAELKNHMGPYPQNFPETRVKVLYDESAIHVFFRVKEKYIRCEEKEDQGKIWEDSCVEFFFSPCSDYTEGYFNIEVNCKGSMVFCFQKRRDIEKKLISKGDLKIIKRYTTLSDFENYNPENMLTWFVQYSVPFSLLTKYFENSVKPEPGIKWFANFYKCGDKTAYPHWLTWNKVEKETPDFHLPEQFGIIRFT